MWIIRATVRHPLLDPAVEHTVFVTSLFHSLTTAVRRLSRCLQQKQALCRRCWKEATTASFLDEVLKIFIRIKTKQGKLKPILAARLAMAAPRVTPKLRKDRNDFDS